MISVSQLVWKLFVLLLPGIISLIFIRYFTKNENFRPFYFAVYAAIIGLVDYMVLEMGFFIKGVLCDPDYAKSIGDNLSIWGSLDEGSRFTLNFMEVLYSFVVATPIAGIISWIVQHRWVIWLGDKLKMTDRFGDDEVWSFFLEKDISRLILVREHKRNLTYYGEVDSYSTSRGKKELLLHDVTLYTTDRWEELYSTDWVYLQLEPNNFSLETPTLKHSGNEEKEEK